MGQQGINTRSSTPSLADRLLFVGWLFAELSASAEEQSDEKGLAALLLIAGLFSSQ